MENDLIFKSTCKFGMFLESRHACSWHQISNLIADSSFPSLKTPRMTFNSKCWYYTYPLISFLIITCTFCMYEVPSHTCSWHQKSNLTADSSFSSFQTPETIFNLENKTYLRSSISKLLRKWVCRDIEPTSAAHLLNQERSLFYSHFYK